MLLAHTPLYSAGFAKEWKKGAGTALQNPLQGQMRGAELRPGVFRFSEVTLTNLAQVVSNGLFGKHYTVNVWDFFKGPSCTLQIEVSLGIYA